MNGKSKSTTRIPAQNRPGRILAALLITIVSIPTCGPVTAQEPEPEPETRPIREDEDRSIISQLVDEADKTEDEQELVLDDDCALHRRDQALQEKSQEVLRSWSCRAFRWFDSWWGDEYPFEGEKVSGWMTAGGEYRDYDGFDGRLRLKVRAPLPNLSRRWDVWLGRFDDESYVSDTLGQGGGFYTPGVVDRDEDDSWLLGMGHRRGGRKSGWDWNVGLRLRLPPEPYVKASYFHYSKFSANSELRLRQTFFWRSDRGFGTTSRGDLTWALRDTDVMRWEATATLAEDTDGTKWYAGQTWYHLMPNRHAFSLLAYVKGETDAEVELKDAGLNFIWRRPFTRDYLYLSMGPTVTWPRVKKEDDRELNIGFGVWLEMEFGDWHY